MLNNFFFLTTFDSLSGAFIAHTLKTHPDIHCDIQCNDAFVQTHARKPAETLDTYMQNEMRREKKFTGSAQKFTAFELHHKSLSEHTYQYYKVANILVAPTLRIRLLMNSWIDSTGSAEIALHYLEKKLERLVHDRKSVYSQLKQLAAKIFTKHPEAKDTAESKLFVFALAKLICFESRDLPTAVESFPFESIVHSTDNFIEFAQYLTEYRLKVTGHFYNDISAKLEELAKHLSKYRQPDWTTWQQTLLDEFLYYPYPVGQFPYTDQQLGSYYERYYQTIKPLTCSYNKLVSIHLNSNRPAQLNLFFDSIEKTAADPTQIEVVINIDEENKMLARLLEKAKEKRKFTLKYIRTPKPKNFCDLWQPLNKLLTVTEPSCYFVFNLSDEILFKTVHWDKILKKYIGLFPDHIFRLRTSRNKFRHYTDAWECSFNQDCLSITTKRWMDIVGNWNPCFGPDGFQQLIAYYLNQEGKFSRSQFHRDIPIMDIEFHGDLPGLGIAQDKQWENQRNHLIAMLRCQSYKMQLEAKRRAMLLKANILAARSPFVALNIVEKKRSRKILLVDKNSKEVKLKISYKLNRIVVGLRNQYRKLWFGYYTGGGKETKQYGLGYLSYLKARYKFVNKIFHSLKGSVFN